jgi:Rrf2 family protein
LLSTTSKYALRALAELARQPNGDCVRGQELAESTAIPPQYLSHIMLRLRNAGYVAATRGSGGGYRLEKPANTISLISVVELFEGRAARPQCFLGINNECDPAHPCSAHASWGSLRAMYLGFLEHTMLSEISRAPRLPLGIESKHEGGQQ